MDGQVRMMRFPITRTMLFATVSAVALLAAVGARAASVSVSDSIQLDDQSATSAAPVGAPNFPDILDYQNTEGSHGFVHVYGTNLTPVYFGARSSGSGKYDVSSQVLFNQTLTNPFDVPTHVTFTFTITSGEVLSPLAITDGGHAESALTVSIKRDGNEAGALAVGRTIDDVADGVENNTVTTTNSASGTGLTPIGSDAGVVNYWDFGGSQLAAATGFTINGQTLTLDLGTVGALGTFDLSYLMKATAKGQRGARTTGTTVSAEIQCAGPILTEALAIVGDGENPGQVPLGDAGYGGPAECVPASVDLPVSSDAFSIARSGDPFNFSEPVDGTLSPPDFFAPFFVTFEPVDVPEPGTLAVLGASLAGLAAMRRRRRSGDAAAAGTDW